MIIYYDPDEWETITTVTAHTASMGQRRRSPEEVQRIKAEKLRIEEDEILRKAKLIMEKRKNATTY